MKKFLEDNSIIDFARSVVTQEQDAIGDMIALIDSDFTRIAKLIFESRGRLIVTGIGKSAIIAQKIVATFNSTGTPAVFLHAADAIHGDLGIVQPHDIVLCISKSGNSPEIKVLAPLIKRMGNTLIGMVGNMDSFLSSVSDYRLNTTVSHEACPNNLAPTTSTTAQLVMGDALGMTLLKMRGFTAEDFSRFHPGGALGKKLYTRVEDIITGENRPRVSPIDHLDKIIIEISSGRLGATAVIDENEQIVGIITDGDLRRMLEGRKDILRVRAEDIMSRMPKTVEAEELAIDAYQQMENNKITGLIVTRNGDYCGIIHLHDILREGVV
ncbi:MAG: KpsF/GutQ family sugar-phosphate isomerase [Mucinivorans sp.]